MTISRSSFRDPAGSLTLVEGRALRRVKPAGRAVAELYFDSPILQRLKEDGLLIGGARVLPAELPSPLLESVRDGEFWIEHPPIPFPTYPGEWTWSMLRDAALLTLELAKGLLTEGLELKDATPWNILFRDARPVFVDALSFEARPESRPYWKAYGQFLSTFLYPLLAVRRRGLTLARVFCERGGLATGEALRLLGAHAWVSPVGLKRIVFPHLLAKVPVAPQARGIDPGVAGRVIRNLLAALEREIRGLRAPSEETMWGSYERALPYTREGALEKVEWIGKILDKLPGSLDVLDLGANTGTFSRLAGTRGHRVVAVERDPGCADSIYLHAKASGHQILPVVMNWGAPTAAGGWAGSEIISFPERSRNRFDVVLALAFMHHLRFVEGVPLEAQVNQLAEHVRGHLLLEWVGSGDPMVRALSQAHGFMPADYAQESLEAALARRFRLIERHGLPGGERWLYWLERIH